MVISPNLQNKTTDEARRQSFGPSNTFYTCFVAMRREPDTWIGDMEQFASRKAAEHLQNIC